MGSVLQAFMTLLWPKHGHAYKKTKTLCHILKNSHKAIFEVFLEKLEEQATTGSYFVQYII